MRPYRSLPKSPMQEARRVPSSLAGLRVCPPGTGRRHFAEGNWRSPKHVTSLCLERRPGAENRTSRAHESRLRGPEPHLPSGQGLARGLDRFVRLQGALQCDRRHVAEVGAIDIGRSGKCPGEVVFVPTDPAGSAENPPTAIAESPRAVGAEGSPSRPISTSPRSSSAPPSRPWAAGASVPSTPCPPVDLVDDPARHRPELVRRGHACRPDR